LPSDRQTHGYLPIADWLFSYQKGWLWPDLIAGLTTAAVVIPKAMAYATIAGLPVQVGLYTALVPLAIYALMGTSRPLSVSTTTTIAVLTATELGQVVPGGDPASLLKTSAMLTLLVGGILILASLLRLGFIANFISEPVLVGFKAGIGLVIVLDQIPKILGIHIPRASFFHNVLAIVRGIPEAKLTTLAVGLAMIVLLVVIERFLPQMPAPLIAVAVGIMATRFLGLQEHGVELVGRIPQGLPSITLPEFSLVQELWPGALGIALMSFTETMAAGRAFASSEEPPLRPNRELLATGIANAGGAFVGAMPARWRHLPDRREQARRGAHSTRRVGYSHGCAGDNLNARATSSAHASSNARRCGYRLLDRIDSTKRVPGDPKYSAN
jgi:SulP family sulfate permease